MADERSVIGTVATEMGKKAVVLGAGIAGTAVGGPIVGVAAAVGTAAALGGTRECNPLPGTRGGASSSK